MKILMGKGLFSFFASGSDLSTHSFSYHENCTYEGDVIVALVILV